MPDFLKGDDVRIEPSERSGKSRATGPLAGLARVFDHCPVLAAIENRDMDWDAIGFHRTTTTRAV